MSTLVESICAFVDSHQDSNDDLPLLRLGYDSIRCPDRVYLHIKAARLSNALKNELAVRVIVCVATEDKNQGLLIDDLSLFPAQIWLSAIKTVFLMNKDTRPSILQSMKMSELLGNRTGVANRLPCALRGNPVLLPDNVILKKLNDSSRTSFRSSDMIDLEACSRSRVVEYMDIIKNHETVQDRVGNIDLICAAAVLKKHYVLCKDAPEGVKKKFTKYARMLGMEGDILAKPTNIRFG